MFIKNFNTTIFTTSLILLIEGLSLIVCVPFAYYYHEPIIPFFIPALISISFGLLFYIFSSKANKKINNKFQIIILITYSWILLITIGTTPYLLSKTMPSYLNTLFETVSGFTTTGTTILTDIESLPKSILFWRSMTHWIGGMGALFMAIIVLPYLNFGGYKIFTINLFPKTNYLKRIIKLIFIIYFVLTFAQIILLFLGGMNLFESFCYAFGTVSTGNFYPNNNGLAEYSSFIQYIMLFFMILSGISYVFYYFIITRKIRTAVKNEEVKLFALIIFTLTLLISCILYFNLLKDIEPAFRESLFHVVSFITTSGYSITNYLIWPSYILIILVFFLFIGGCSVSSSGGIKMSRFLILIRNLKMSFKMFIPQSTEYKIKYDKKNLDENTNLSVLTYITVFGITFMLGTFALSLLAINFKVSAFLSLSALSTFGYNQSLANLPEAGKIVLMFLMLLGRLEIYTFLLLITPTINTKEKHYKC